MTILHVLRVSVLLAVLAVVGVVPASARMAKKSITSLLEIQKIVVAHHMVGNTYPYTRSDWTRDIDLAASKGIDGFALNLGRDYWQPDRINDAYESAKGKNFVLFLSFDMTSLPCSSPDDATPIRNLLIRHQHHENQYRYKGRTFVSTFSGENCFFGQGSLDAGWNYALHGSTEIAPVHFSPAFFIDPAGFRDLSAMDGAFNWNSGWPSGNDDINDASDRQYQNALRPIGRTYMAAVSPWFFTHYGPDSYNKNWIYRPDDWLLASRWEMLVRDRERNDMVQIISWNDYGESHYVGPIAGAQPNSETWVNGFDHTGWLDLIAYYAAAFKTGSYPIITKDRIFMWARLYPAEANANDSVGRPSGYQYTRDTLWVVVLLTRPADVILSCGSMSQRTSCPAGLSKLQLPLAPEGNSCDVGGVISRNGQESLVVEPKGFRFEKNPRTYNFNAFVAASP